MMLFFFSAFLLIALKGELRWQGFALAVAVPVLIYIATMWLPRFFPADKLLLSIANFLCGLGVLVLYSTDLDAGTSRGLQQAINYSVGIAAMLFCILIVRYVRRWKLFVQIVRERRRGDFIGVRAAVTASGLFARRLRLSPEQPDQNSHLGAAWPALRI